MRNSDNDLEKHNANLLLKSATAIFVVKLKMKILLLGEYSNVHATLAKGLRAQGHDVTVASNGDDWKNYPRDIDLQRKSAHVADTMNFLYRLGRALPKMKGYDVVQLINPVFIDLKAERITPIYRFLRRNNKKIILGAFGMDYYYAKACLDCTTFRYSDFNIGSELRNNPDTELFVSEWINGEKGELNRMIAEDCDGIVSGLYEYDAAYRLEFPEKTQFIPFPIDLSEITIRESAAQKQKTRFFIGIQRNRDAYKGTDIMYRALVQLAKKYPDRIEIVRAESVPFEKYCKMMDRCDVLLDQLYSYTPAMNALLAMAKGLVVVGGGEEENYTILNEKTLRPIVNVTPSQEDVFNKMEELILHPDNIVRRSKESIEYVRQHHDLNKVTQQYIAFWNSVGNTKSPNIIE